MQFLHILLNPSEFYIVCCGWCGSIVVKRLTIDPEVRGLIPGHDFSETPRGSLACIGDFHRAC